MIGASTEHPPQPASSAPPAPARPASDATGTLDLSIVVPALNEADNLAPLIQRLDAVLQGVRYEVLIVDDDSRDATPQVCAQLAQRYPVRLLVRTAPKNGLSGAVLHGMAQARGEVLAVMDADLQHPPERLPALIDPLRTDEADFVIGSRYMPGGSTEAEWGLLRKLNSRIATLLARPFAGRTTDPMAGFFALKRSTYLSARNLTPLGYKIALELMCKTRARNVREVPIHFGLRNRGESKLTLKQQFRYLEHLSRLYDFTFPRASPIVKFLIATAVSWFVAFAAYVSLAGAAGRSAALFIAYVIAIGVTAVFHVRYVRTQREFIPRPRPWLDFALIAVAELAACGFATAWMSHRAPTTPSTELFLIVFTLATMVRYVLRKEFMQDIRGLRKEIRLEELKAGE